MESVKEKVRLSTIYKRYFDLYLENPKYLITKETFKAVNQTIACRTSRIGVNIYECPECHEQKHVLRSCKNRFCPRCGYADTKQWADKMLGKIADCGHHHIVFTLPSELRILSKQNKDVIHSLLLKSSAETIIDWFKAKYRIIPGIMNVLHTAGSDQKYHPHVHMLCSAGGINEKGDFVRIDKTWYLVNQKFLSKKFRWHFEGALIKAFKKGELETVYGSEIEFKEFIRSLNEKHWVVSIQKPLKKADDIVNYVGRYTKRACISEHNIVSADSGDICFKYKDYKNSDHKGKPEMSTITLSYRDFFGRLFEHVPSKGFRMVRYYGMYSNRKIRLREEDKVKRSDISQPLSWRDYQKQKTGIDPLICQCCGKEMLFVEEYYDVRHRLERIRQKDKIPDYWKEAG